MTIEEKAKSYDEAIKYAQYLMNERCKEGTDGSFHRSDLQKMFPELKESEDERIRKALINGFNKLDKSAVWYNGITNGQILARLEKQDNTKLGKSIEVASNVLVKLLESDKFQKDVREHLFDKGDKDLSDIYDIYAEEAVKYVKALYKHLNK